MRNPLCTLCELGAQAPRRPRFVCNMASEFEQRDVMVVAEGVGYREEEYGPLRPFVHGVLRDIRKMLTDAGIDAHYTYSIKCPKPDKDYKYKPALVKVCTTNYLLKEIEEVRPKHIIVLGATALKAAAGLDKFTEKRGNRVWSPKANAYIYTSIQQAQAAFDQKNRVTLDADIKLFIRWILEGDNFVRFEPEVKVVKTLAGLRELRDKIAANGGMVAADIETGNPTGNAANPYDPAGYVRCIQFSYDADDGGYFVPLDLEPDCFHGMSLGNPVETFWDEGETLEEAVDIVREILLASRCSWHNGKFDRLWLNKWGKRRFGAPIHAPNVYMDTIHVAHLLNENRLLGLKKLITSELGLPSYDISDKCTKNLDELIPYSTKDTVATLLLIKKYEAELAKPENAKLRRLYKHVIRPVDQVFTRMELRGFPVSVDVAETLRDEITAKRDELQIVLDEFAAEYEMFGVNYGSPKQLSTLLFDTMGFKMNPDRSIAYTRSKGIATDEKALFHLKKHPFIANLIEWKFCNRLLSTYVNKMISMGQTRGRLTSTYKLYGTVTGRTSSGREDEEDASSDEAMNLQNLPSAKDKFGIRKAVRAREGYSIVEVDFSQIELRIAGWLANDPMLLEAYRTGKDVHALRGMRMVGMTEEQWEVADKDFKKDARQKAKPVNFGFLYGMGAFKFQGYALMKYNVTFSMLECNKIRSGYFNDHHALPNWYERQERICKRLGYIETPSGRRRRLPNIKLDPETSKEAAGKFSDAVRQAINSPVQEFGGCLKLMSLIEIDERIPISKGILIGEIHDSIIMEVKNEYAEEVAREVIEIMRHPRLMDVLGIEMPVPIDADAKIGPSLGEAKEVHL